MCGAILPLPQYDFMWWCSVEAQGQLYLYLYFYPLNKRQGGPQSKSILTESCFAVGHIKLSRLLISLSSKSKVAPVLN
jgi:hypothetical protein